jgi:hypothetical protein
MFMKLNTVNGTVLNCYQVHEKVVVFGHAHLVLVPGVLKDFFWLRQFHADFASNQFLKELSVLVVRNVLRVLDDHAVLGDLSILHDLGVQVPLCVLDVLVKHDKTVEGSSVN